jgi:glycosyltransferase involved in cell wall biosynthesis/ribosomal protein S18 acetylase RimI-like enzyme
MKILLLVYYFPPEIGSGPHLPYELGESLVQSGHDVTVVTSFPHYHVPEMPEQYRGRFLYTEELGGMKVLRINAPNAHAKSAIVRGIGQQIAPWMLALRALGGVKPDVVFTITPPLTMGLAARLAARWFGAPCVVNVQDLFPQNAVDLGVLRNRILIRFFESLERRLYRTATAITVMSEGNRDYVIAKGAKPEKIFTVFNWVDTDLIQPGDRMNSFRATQGLGDDFMVLFAGTMGWSQGLSVVVEAAKMLATEPGLSFLLVGDGVERAGLERQAAGLPNVRFLPIQSKEVYPQVLAAADAALVTLRPEVGTPTVPSKIATIMAAGRPILASIPLSGDAPRLIASAGAGIVVPPADAQALADAVLKLKCDGAAAEQMGYNGRRYAESHLSRSTVTQQIATILQQTSQAWRDKAGIRAAVEENVANKTDAAGEENTPFAVRRAQYGDLPGIVRVHLAAFSPRFTMSALGPAFLRQYYNLVLRFERGILLVAEADRVVVGFVAGFMDAEGFYRAMARDKRRFALPVLKGLLRRPQLLLRFLHVARRVLQPRRCSEPVDASACELSSIAVDPRFSGKGVGKNLVREFAAAASEAKAREVYLTTDALNNESTNSFYRGLDFQLAQTRETRPGRLMNKYVLRLPPESTTPC